MDDRLKKVAAFLKKQNAKFKKEYGADVLYAGDEAGNFEPFPTGFPTIDNVNSGIGGFPRGGITLIHGLESTGKTTLVLEAIHNAMVADENIVALYNDVENALTEDFLNFKNVFPDRLTITPLNTEDGLTIIKNAIAEDLYDIIVIDSLAKLDSKNMMTGDVNDKKQRNQRARIITEFLRFISFTLRKSRTALVLINQEIENQDRKTKYDPATVLPCGKQQVFSANLRLQIKRSKKIKKGQHVVGYLCSVLSIKNKIAPYERAKTFLSYLYNQGYIQEYSVLDYLVMTGVLKKNMGVYSFVDSKYSMGKVKASDIMEVIEGIRDNYGVDLLQIPEEPIKFDTDKAVEVVVDDDESDDP